MASMALINEKIAEMTVLTALHIAEITEPCGIIVSPHI